MSSSVEPPRRRQRPASWPWRLLLAVVAGALVVGWGVPRASAQLAVGRRALESADFQRALRAFDRAERTERLDREGLVALAEGRVIARFALGTAARARRDLEILAELDPGHAFPVEAPPEVAEALAATVREAGGGLAVELRWEDAPEASTLSVEVQRDAAALVREVRVIARVGEGAWETHAERRVTLAHPPGAVVAVYVELLGPRDVVLRSEGSASAPILHGEPARVGEVLAQPVADERQPRPVVADGSVAASGGSDDVALAVGLGVGAAALVAVAVVVGVVLGTQTSSQTQPTTPIVAWELP